MNPLVGGTGLTASRSDMVVLHQAGVAGDFNSSSDAVAIALHPSRLDGNPMVVAGNVVQQFCWTSDRGDDDVNLAVVRSPKEHPL
jgi:hypothetical protein